MNFFTEASRFAGFHSPAANLTAPCDALRFASGRVLRSVAQVPGLPPTGPFRPRLGILVFAFFSFRQSLDQPPAKRPSPALRTFCCFQLRCRFQLRNLWLSACPVTWA